MKRTLATLVLALACGCAAPVPPAPEPAGAARFDAASALASATPRPAETIGDRRFAPVTLAQLQATTRGVALPLKPPAVGQYSLFRRPQFRGTTSRARRMESGNFVFEADFPDDQDPPAPVAAVLAAELGAPPADLADAAALAAWTAPLRAAWAAAGAADVALVTAYAYFGPRFAPNEGFDPGATRDEAGILANAGWPLAYDSKARHETLWIYAGGLALLVRRGPAAYTAATAPITAEAAARTYAAAVRDPAATTTEARSGLDHFLGVPYADAFPATAWDPFNVHDDDAPAWDFPADARWEASFDGTWADRPVWRVGVPTGMGFGGGMVDAVTGAVVRMYRVTPRWRVAPVAPSPFTPS